jgi:predicted component of viral defense system (DUF524 family)
MKTPVETAFCGPYELVAQRAGSLNELDNGALGLEAESRYLVRLHPGADSNALAGSLTVPSGGSEGILQFGNFVGTALLGGRVLNVRSNRLSADAVQGMLDDVADQLASLPFGAATPTAAPYTRARALAPDALYHAYAFLRDTMRARGRHDLPGALERILARPHESLTADAPRLVPLGHVMRIDAATLDAIQSAPDLLARVAPTSPLAAHPLARHLDGRMPELVRVVPLAHDTDTPENRFVVAALDAMTDVARRVEKLARASARPSAAINAGEAADMADTLQRWRRHRALDQLQPSHALPLHSTVLRGRAGYRELVAAYLELLARTRLAEPHDVQPLLETRDAALIYEYWCYFKVVAAVSAILSRVPNLTRFAATELGTHVPYGYLADWGAVQAIYNLSYAPSNSEPRHGRDSYSVRLRPDITLRSDSGQLNLFDAKLKLELGAAFSAPDVEDVDNAPDTFKREDLHKMHAYRDAIDADSVWILYPGTDPTPKRYEDPWSVVDDGPVFRGVGAIALRPDAHNDGGLAEIVHDMLGAS